MPKMKTRKSASKRYRRTGTGKVRRAKAFGSHIMTKKGKKRKRRLRKNDLLDRVDVKRVSRLLPYA
jgi:large subunit ribosomal protein L35